MKKSKELLGLCCPEVGCDYWEKPPMVSIDYEIICPHCEVELEKHMGHYEIEPGKWHWYGRSTDKYVNFIKHEKIEPIAGMLFTGDLEVGEPEHVLPVIGDLEEASSGEESGKKLDEMLTQFTGADEVERIVHADIPVDTVGVHATHCCVVHGCKYGDRNCPVVLGEVKQEYICEECEECEGWTSLLDVFTKVKEQQNGMLPYISHENYEKLYSEDIGLAVMGDPYEKLDEEIGVMGNYVDDHEFEFEKGLPREEHACFENYRGIASPTVLEKLHFIEGMKIIYDIHYCSVGVGIVFYYSQNDKGDYRSGLSVDCYYDNFEDCISGEARKIYDARMSWL